MGRVFRAEDARRLSAAGTGVIARPVTLPLYAFAVLAVLGAVANGEAAAALIANAAVLVSLAFGYAVLGARSPDRPVGLIRVMLLLQSISIVMLILANIIQDDVLYVTTDGGVYSHRRGAVLVAALNVVMAAGMLVPGVRARRGALARESIVVYVSRISAPALGMFEAFSVGFFLVRLALLFEEVIGNEVAGYALRLYASYCMPVVFFVGVGVRRGRGRAYGVAAIGLAVSFIVLLAGSRWDALISVIFMGLGYATARPTSTRQLMRWALIGTAIAAVASFTGQILRQDDRGRTGQAALERLENFGDRLSGTGTAEQVTDSTISRLISNSAHAVITRVPDEIPFEENGVLNIPGEIVSTFLPRLNWSGTSAEMPRNWILNQFGFLVNWRTSVEFALLPDAWFRGGYLGVIVVSVFVGVILQVVEGGTYRSLGRRPESLVILLCALNALPGVGGRDVVTALRTLVFNVAAGTILAFAVRVWVVTVKGQPQPRAALRRAV